MAKHFEPSEIYNGNASANGFAFREVDATLKHYGFIAIIGKNSGGHIKYKHREFKDLEYLLINEGLKGQIGDFAKSGIIIPNHKGDTPAGYVKLAAAACLKVKELNAKRRETEDLLPLPEWIPPALDSIVKEDGSSKFDQEQDGDILRLQREPNGEARRSYRIVHKQEGKRSFLEVENLNFPEYCFTYNLNENDRNPGDYFLMLFQQKDDEVKAHIAEREHDYYTKLGRLVANRGFHIQRDDPDYTEVPLLHLTHPGYGLAFDILRVPEHETVAQESIDAVEQALEQSEERYFEDSSVLEQVEQAGWQMNIDHEMPAVSEADLEAIGRGHKQIENAAIMILTSPDGQTKLETPVYGELQALGIDVNKLEELAASESPQAAIPDLRVTPDCCRGSIEERAEKIKRA